MIKKSIMPLLAAAAMLLATETAWSFNSDVCSGPAGAHNPHCSGGPSGVAPELDASAGATAIGLISGGVLLMRERSRGKRKQSKDRKG